MAISRPMGSVPVGASTSQVVTELNIRPGQKHSDLANVSAPCCCDSVKPADPEMAAKREELKKLRLDAAIKKQKAILAGKLSIDKAPDYEY